MSQFIILHRLRGPGKELHEITVRVPYDVGKHSFQGASDSVHELQREVARRYAADEWRRMGARSFEEAYSIYLHDVRPSDITFQSGTEVIAAMKAKGRTIHLCKFQRLVTAGMQAGAQGYHGGKQYWITAYDIMLFEKALTSGAGMHVAAAKSIVTYVDEQLYELTKAGHSLSHAIHQVLPHLTAMSVRANNAASERTSSPAPLVAGGRGAVDTDDLKSAWEGMTKGDRRWFLKTIGIKAGKGRAIEKPAGRTRPPDPNPNDRDRDRGKSRPKTPNGLERKKGGNPAGRPCRDLASGKCKKDDLCCFSHAAGAPVLHASSRGGSAPPRYVGSGRGGGG